MKNTILNLILVYFFSSNVFAQTPNLQWQKSLGGTGTDEARSVYQTSDGGSIILGNSNSINGDVVGNHGSYDYWLVKIDASGNVQWKKTYGGTASDKGYAVIELSYGGYLLVGNASSTDGDVTGNHGASDYWVVRISNSGNIIWQKSFGGTSTDIARGVIQTLDGKLLVIGYSRSSNGNVTGAHGGYDYWLCKLDTSGNLIWQKTYGGTKDELAYTVKQAKDSSYVIVGYTLSNDGDVGAQNHSYKNDIWVVRADKNGSLLWSKTLGGIANDYSNSFIQTSDKGYLIIGYTESYDGDVYGNYGQDDLWAIKLDSTGAIQWQKTFGGTDNDRANFAAETSDGGFVITGHSESDDIDLSQNNGNKDFWMLKLTQNGTLVWKKSVGGTLEDNAYSVAQSTDGGIISVGISASADGDVSVNNGADDFWIVKISNLTVTSPSKGDLWFSGTTRNIKWKSNGASNLKIEYSINGGGLYSTVVASTASGSSQYSWAIPSGINSSQCKIKITDLATSSNIATNDSVFSILTSPVLVSPNGGEILAANTTTYIYWFSKLSATSFNLEYTLDGTNWLPIANGVSVYANASGNNSGFYAWTTPNVTSSTCKIRITDASTPTLKTSSAANFTISQQKSIDIQTPNGGLSYTVGSTLYITWTSQGVNAVNIYFSSDGGATYSSIALNYSNSGYYNWTIPNSTSTNCFIKIVDAVSSTQDVSNSNFLILPAVTSLNLVSPNGGEKWYQGSYHSITWNSSQVAAVKLEYTTGGAYTTIVNSVPASTGSYYWHVPQVVSSSCKIRISNASNASVFDVSNLDFQIADTIRALQLVAPNGGEQWQAGSYKPITFTTNNIAVHDLFYSTDSGFTWNLIANNVTTSPYFWLVPNSQSAACLVRISNGGNLIDYSAAFFTITAPFTGTAPSIATFSVNSFCKNSVFPVNFSTLGTFNSGNYFIAQLSDANGSFALPTSIGSIQSTSAGTINCIVPDYISNGSAYRIRVISDNPPTIGTNNGSSLVINSPEFTFPPATLYYSLPNVVANFSYTGNSSGIQSYLWDFGDNTTSTLATTFHNYTQIGVYDVSLTVTSTNGCSIKKTNTDYIRVDNTFPTFPLYSNTNSDITDISFIDELTGCVSLITGECLFTTDGGNSWIPKLNTGLTDASSVQVLNGKWLMTSADGKVVESNNLGATWQLVSQGGSAVESFTASSLSSPTSGLVVGANGAIYRYTSGNLTAESSGTTANLNAVIDNGSWAIAVGDNANIVKNSGGGWNLQSTGTTADLLDVAFVNSQIGYVCGKGGTLLKTINGGLTWSNSMPPGVEVNFTSIEVKGNDTAWVAGQRGILYQTLDAGNTWTRYSKGVRNDNTGFKVKKDKGYLSGSSGNLRTFQMSGPLGSINKLTVADAILVYPNPSNGNFTLQLIESLAGPILLSVYDYSGKLLSQKNLNGNQLSHQLSFQNSVSTSGIYFLHLQSENGVVIKKISVLK